MSIGIGILDKETKEQLFDTKLLKRMSEDQLIVLAQQIGWELSEREKKNEKKI